MDPYIGEIRVFGFHFAPRDWALCNGQIMPIAQNTALYSILGTTFGGDGQTTYGLPNFQDSAPMHWGNGPGLTPCVLGEVQGTPNVTLLITEMPAHNHMLESAQQAAAPQSVGTPTANTFMGLSNPGPAYVASSTPNATFSPKAIGVNGGSQPHNNLQPLTTLNFCIALYGIFPQRS